jgi:YidC/Oxa1 family membrane protein insertase
MLKIMPWIFILFCYTFSCALALYSTINGLFTIGQQMIINRMKDDGDPATAPVGADGLKNVTPAKKKKLK